MALFEAACILIISLTLYAMARRRRPAALLRDYAALALSAWVGEQSCIFLYGFYNYDPSWHGRIGQVPILVPLIWPLVILSAFEVVQALGPRARGAAQVAACGALVAVDASLVEVVAVRAGLWRWAEPGHLGVPLLGILGWSYFAVGAAWGLKQPPRRRVAALLLAGPLCAHALILLSWWGLFRWTLRGDLADRALWGIALLGVTALFGVLRLRRRGGGIPLPVALPRALAASLFLLLLLVHAPTDGRLWLHAAAVALPYCAATCWQEPRPRVAWTLARRESAP